MTTSRAPRLTSPVLPGFLFGLVLLSAAALTLMAPAPPPLPNGLGLLPATVNLVQRSGVMLSDPSGSPGVSRSKAISVALGQGRQDGIEGVVLADVNGVNGSSLGSARRLCWVVFLEAGPNSSGDLPAPGDIDLYLVLVDARSGRFLVAVIAFHGGPRTGVGSE